VQTNQHLLFPRLDALAERALDQGWIDAKEAEVLQRAEVSRLRSINVDEFEPEALAVPVPEKAPQPASRASEAA